VVAPAAGERLGAAARLLDRRLARVGGDVVEDLPERLLDLVLGVGGDLGEQIAGAVDRADSIGRRNISTVRGCDGSKEASSG
jgi:hypothetical protein